MGISILKIMKFLIAALVLSLATVSMQQGSGGGSTTTGPSCSAVNYCMGCDPVYPNKCTSCYNFGSGTVGARILANGSCTYRRSQSLIDGCKYYSGMSTNDVKAQVCMRCNDGLHMNFEYNNAYAVPSCNNTHCSGTSTMTNCKQRACFKLNNQWSEYCMACSNGWTPS